MVNVQLEMLFNFHEFEGRLQKSQFGLTIILPMAPGSPSLQPGCSGQNRSIFFGPWHGETSK